jgi:hypothetical protein
MVKLNKIIGGNGNTHTWHFSRVGGVNRVNLESGADLIHLGDLDQKLWTALSCPVYGLEIDFKTLELIDTDNDGKIRVPEVIAAVKWLTALIKNPDELLTDPAKLPLSSINDSTEEGRNLLESARQILSNLGKPDAEEISTEETSDTVRIFADTKFNGDGIITEDSAEDEKIRTLIRDIISCMGPVTDRSGKEGISGVHVADFYKACEDYSTWQALAEADPEKILPFGNLTVDALFAFDALRAKLGDYFIRCRLSEFNPASADILGSLNAKFEEIRDKDLSLIKEEIASFPLAGIEKGGTLSMVKGINPAWEKEMEKFRLLVVQPLFPGKLNLTESDFNSLVILFEGYRNWQSVKTGTVVEKLGLTRIRELLKTDERKKLDLLIEADKALETKVNNIFKVDKLVRFYRDIFKLLRNYVTFYDFYSPDSYAIFQAGKLYIDQRCCDLCLRVTDMAKHNSLARFSGLCLIYCDCYSKKLNEKLTIVAALTDGDFDNIDVGRNGIFYDRKGNDWDATITRIIDNPISIRQAFWSPYRKVSRFISTQIEKFAAAKDKEVTSTATGGIEKTTEKVDTGIKGSIQGQPAAPVQSAAPPAPFDIGKFVGIFAALSLALGAIGSVIMSVITGFLALKWWMMPLAILAIVLLISGPSMILAWLKLRKRNLAPVLDANGWAINARATVNIIFGATLTHIAVLPEGAKLNLTDPFSKKRRPVIPITIALVIIAILVYLLWYYDIIAKWF